MTDATQQTPPPTLPAAAEQAEAERRKHTGYNNPAYARVKKRVIDIIPQVSIYEAIDKYAGHISLGLFGIAMGNMFKQENGGNPFKNRTTLALVSAALTAALTGIFAHYKRYRLEVPADIDHKEGYTTASADLTGQAIADSLRPYLHSSSQKTDDTPAPAAAAKKDPDTPWAQTLDKIRTEQSVGTEPQRGGV